MLNKVLYTFIVSALGLYVTWEFGPLHLVSEAGYSCLFKPVSILVPKIINERPNKHNPTQPTESTPLRWTSDRAATCDRVAMGPLRAIGPLDALKGQEYCMMRRQDC